MKSKITLIVLLTLNVLFLKAQNVIYDGETKSPDFWDIGGGFGVGYDQGPNGADCHQGEGWKLYVSGKMDILNEGVVNPDINNVNNTEKVVRFVRAKNGEGWAGAALNVLGLKIKENNINKLSILVKKSVEGNVTLKLEGNGVTAQQQTQLYNTPGQWQKLIFIFESASFAANPENLLVFPHDQGGLTDNIITYWDEVTTYNSSDVASVMYDGNNPIGSETNPGFFLDGYWGPNGSLSDLLTDVFPNLNPTGINSSNHVMRFLRAKDGKSWCGMGLGGQNIDVALNPKMSLMINKPFAGRVGMKLEGAGSQEVYADYTTPGEWAKLIFTFDPSAFTGRPTGIVIFPHFEDTEIPGQNLVYHTPVYIDNVMINDTSTGIIPIVDQTKIISSKFYNIQGMYVTNDFKELRNGIYIQQSTLTNGQISSEKIFVNR